MSDVFLAFLTILLFYLPGSKSLKKARKMSDFRTTTLPSDKITMCLIQPFYHPWHQNLVEMWLYIPKTRVAWQTGYCNLSIKTKPKQDRALDRFIFSCCLTHPECLNNTNLYLVSSVISKNF